MGNEGGGAVLGDVEAMHISGQGAERGYRIGQTSPETGLHVLWTRRGAMTQ